MTTDDATAAAIAPALHAARLRQQYRLRKVPAAERASAYFHRLDRFTLELADDLTPILGAARAMQFAERHNVAMLTKLLDRDGAEAA